MTLKQIEFYEAVCQAGNVTAAAQQLYVSRSVISRAIQELEDELDIQLFVRGRNGMELTEYGKTLRNLLSQFKGFYSALLAQISSLKETGENHSLTVGLAISCWNVFPLEIAIHHYDSGFIIVQFAYYGRNFIHAGQFTCPFSSVPGNDFISAVFQWTDKDRYQHAILLDALYCFLHPVVIHHTKGMILEGNQ